MKKIYFTRFIKLLVLFVSVFLVCTAADIVLIKADGYDERRISDFYYEDKNSMDVVLLGASEAFADFIPPYAYELGGFTSYCYAVSSNSAEMYKTQLKEILSRQSPKLILVEPNGFVYDENGLGVKELYARAAQSYLESVPLTLNKIAAVFSSDIESRIVALLPILKHHEQLFQVYDRLGAMGFNSPSVLKGAFTITKLNHETCKYSVPEGTDGYELTPLYKSYLIDFLDYCKSEELDNIVFVRFPHKYNDEDAYIRACRSNVVEELVQQYGFEYIDLEECADDIGIDYDTDFFDQEHLSVYGQIKSTEYLTNIITEQYGIVPMAQSEENTARWEKSAKYIRAYFMLADEIIKSGDKQYIWETPEIMNKLDEILAAAPAEGLSLPTAD